MIVPLLVLGVVIGSNNLAASLALGALGQVRRRWRIVLVFGVFEFVIPLVGIWAGRQLSTSVAEHGEWIGPTLLTLLGTWAIVSAFRDGDDDEKLARRVTTWGGLSLLALGLSIDNLIVGFSLGLHGQDPLVVAGTIAVFSMVFAYAGLRLGSKARRHVEEYAKFGTGVLLIALAGAMVAGFI